MRAKRRSVANTESNEASNNGDIPIVIKIGNNEATRDITYSAYMNNIANKATVFIPRRSLKKTPRGDPKAAKTKISEVKIP